MGLGEEKGETTHTEASETLPIPSAVIHCRVRSRFIDATAGGKKFAEKEDIVLGGES